MDSNIFLHTQNTSDFTSLFSVSRRCLENIAFIIIFLLLHTYTLLVTVNFGINGINHILRHKQYSTKKIQVNI